MQPTLLKGDYVIASSFPYVVGSPPQRGDLIVFRPPGRPSYIKRLMGEPGDRIQLTDGVVYLNGQALQREKLAPGAETGPFGFSHPVERFRETLPSGRSYITYAYGADGEAETTGVYVVPAGRFFVLSDNRDNGLDSRFPETLGGGYVRSQDIRGRIDVVIALGRNASDAQPRRFVQFPK
jgi:signal peptidase I